MIQENRGDVRIISNFLATTALFFVFVIRETVTQPSWRFTYERTRVWDFRHGYNQEPSDLFLDQLSHRTLYDCATCGLLIIFVKSWFVSILCCVITNHTCLLMISKHSPRLWTNQTTSHFRAFFRNCNSLNSLASPQWDGLHTPSPQWDGCW